MANPCNNLKLRLLNDSDIPLMKVWLHKEHIKKWYDIPPVCTVDDWLNEIQNRNDEFGFITHFIVFLEEIPIGFCQYYKCTDAKEDWYGQISLSGAYSIDYFIGEEEYIGKGIGKSIIALLVTKIFALSDSETIIVQPDEKNKASCHSLLSNGFVFDKNNNVYLISKANITPSFSIRYVSELDKSFWFTIDEHMCESEFHLKIRDKRGYIVSDGNKPIGVMRYNLFWDSIPFLTLIHFEKASWGKGFGKQAMLFWESEMRELGYKMVMTSTQVDEQAQHFYRKLGYIEKGSLSFDNTPLEQPLEMFLLKTL